MVRFSGVVLVFCFVFSGTSFGLAQARYEMEPINYSRAKPTDKIYQFSQNLKNGAESLEWNEENGYLKSLLSKLKVPVSSQALVFSKTSLQVSRITPSRPRAVYFNDDIYIGWVQNGRVIEISAADPELGATFYTLSQKKSKRPIVERETSRCLQCHGSSHTRGKPGHIVRSVFPTDTGLPQYNLGTHLIDGGTEYEKRFGGWYVTGTHGKLRHMGNSWLPKTAKTGMKRFERDASELDIEKHANLESLDSLLDTSPYLTGHSDLVAQLVLQHQVHMHNVLTAAIFAGRQAAHDAVVMNEVLEREPGFESESTISRYTSAAERVVKALLFCDEVPLVDPVKGSSNFATDFEKQGPFDSKERSLRQLDLQGRLFRYPCSFLIYSDSFRNLPVGVKVRVIKRLNEVLLGEDTSDEFDHLAEADRSAIKAILDETLETR
jgi:hypothetical protein